MNENEMPGVDFCACADDSCIDEERHFYAVVAGGLDGETLRDVSKDLFDASLGTHHGISSDGHAVVLLVADMEVAKNILSAVEHWQSHACQKSIEIGMFLLHLVGAHYMELFSPTS